MLKAAVFSTSYQIPSFMRTFISGKETKFVFVIFELLSLENINSKKKRKE
jgi:hypothetical protein